MFWRNFWNDQKRRLALTELGQNLAAIKQEHALIADRTSPMIGSRIRCVESDYWKAVAAYSRQDGRLLSNLVSAGSLEIEFIRKLMEAETTERELGESMFFEYGDKSNSRSSRQRLDKNLQAIACELVDLLESCKRARQ